MTGSSPGISSSAGKYGRARREKRTWRSDAGGGAWGIEDVGGHKTAGVADAVVHGVLDDHEAGGGGVHADGAKLFIGPVVGGEAGNQNVDVTGAQPGGGAHLTGLASQMPPE